MFHDIVDIYTLIKCSLLSRVLCLGIIQHKGGTSAVSPTVSPTSTGDIQATSASVRAQWLSAYLVASTKSLLDSDAPQFHQTGWRCRHPCPVSTRNRIERTSAPPPPRGPRNLITLGLSSGDKTKLLRSFSSSIDGGCLLEEHWVLQ